MTRADLSRADLYAGAHIVVTGLGVSGVAVVRALSDQGAQITVVDEAPKIEHTKAIESLGANVVSTLTDFSSVDLLVTSPGWAPHHPLLMQAREEGIDIIGDVELAWRLDQERSLREGTPTPRWIAVTGTNGKTTTVGMVASMLKAAGIHSVAAGNVGYSLVDAVLASPRFDVLAVELSSFQLHWAPSLTPHAGAVINIAQDHVDWHGSMEAYAADKVSLLRSSQIPIINVDDADTVFYARGIPALVHVTRDIPRVGELGVVEEMLVDRAFTAGEEAVEVATTADITLPAPHNITNALVAAALARSIGLEPQAVAEGLRRYHSDGHRISAVDSIDGVLFVDDSKATNPHAAQASLSAFPSVVWIAGGLAKGAEMDELVRSVAPRLRAVVLIGSDRELIADALGRHAAHVPVRRIDPPDTSQVRDSAPFMASIVSAARSMAQSGDAVLLAPACASMDQFTSYAHRGDLFAEAVRALP